MVVDRRQVRSWRAVPAMVAAFACTLSGIALARDDAAQAEATKRTPLGSKLYHTRENSPVLLKRDMIVSGEQLVDARYGRLHCSSKRHRNLPVSRF